MTGRARWLPEWRRTLRFWGRDVEHDIDDELRFHLEMRERDFLARGLAPADARDAALARFGDVDPVRAELREHDRQQLRHQHRIEIMSALLQDLRYGARKLRQAPGFTVAVVLTLALGIGVNTAVFSAIDAVLLRPLPFVGGDRLAIVEHVDVPSVPLGDRVFPKGAPDIHDLRARKDVAEDVAAYAPGGLNLTGVGDPTRVKIGLATTNLFGMLGVKPQLGRAFVEAENRPDLANVVVLSDALWHRQYGGDPGIVGRTIALNGVAHTVVGVMPPKFALPTGAELWIPLVLPFDWKGARREAIQAYLPSTMIARLAPGVMPEQADARVRAMLKPYLSPERLAELGTDPVVMPMQETLVRDRRTALLVLMGAAALVLLTACANVANLLSSRAAARRRELAVRAALGATRGRLVQQLLVESLLLAISGGVAGLAVATVTLKLISALVPAGIADVVVPSLDPRVLGFSLVLATLTGLAFGLWPAVGATRGSTANSIRLAGGHGATSSDGAAMRRALVVCEVAFAVMLLVGAGLMLKSFRALVATDTGVEIERVASVQLALPMSSYRLPATRQAFYDRVLARLRATPGVESAAAITQLPLRGDWGIGLNVHAEGRAEIANPAERIYPQYLRVTSGYFGTMGIRLLAGREIDARDDSSRGAVINQAMASAMWPGENALGKRFAMGTMPGEPARYITVVGIAEDVRSHTIDKDANPQMYLPFTDSPSQFAGIVARGREEPEALFAALREAVRAGDPEIAAFNVETLEQAVAGTLAPRRTNTLLIAGFGLLAVALSALGVYAVIAHGVAGRTREIGIRIALGAGIPDVLRMVVREGVVLAAIGAAIGVGGAWALSRLMESLLYGTSARDPLVFVLAPVVLVLLAVLATLVPARRASRVDPMIAIRAE